MSMPPELLTLGHGTASEEDLARLICGANITSLIDVRSVPKSRRHPHFWREEMERWVPKRCGSLYHWEPLLGGFRKPDPQSSNVALRHPSFRAYADYMESDAFAAALAALLEEAATTRSAIMCSETLWWRCHRRLIADAAVLLHGATVKHVLHDGKLSPHQPTPCARVTEAGMLRYDLLFEGDLPILPM